MLAILAESALRSSALGCAARLGMMGLNGGPRDAGNRADRLARVLVDSAPESLLDLYNRQRRTVAVDFLQEQSITNKRRLEAKYPEGRRPNFEKLAAIATDPARARQYLLRTFVLARQARVAARTPRPPAPLSAAAGRDHQSVVRRLGRQTRCFG